MRMLAIAIALFLAAISLPAAAADDKATLEGLKEVKVAFDLREGSAKGLLHQLDVIDETRQSLIKQGVTPHFVVTFRGPATKLVQGDESKMKPEDRPMAGKIAERIKQLSASPGVESFEQCGVAAREQGIDPARVVPPVHVVGNGFISLMAYQSRGYGYIAP
jgi:intracellular sulfur oxidation DsrE/DsrF family protein